MTPVIEALDLRVERGSRVLLDAVSLRIFGGEILAVMGENGAGKSTLLRVLAGDFAPDRGTVSLDGRPLSAWTVREQARRRAVLPQQTTVAFGFTALEIVLMGRSPFDGGRPGTPDRSIAFEALRRVDATAFAERPYPTLSGGERARVLLARAFAQVLDDGEAEHRSPRALLLDEPSAALDVAHQQSTFSALHDLAIREGVAVVVVVHDVNLALRHADRVALLKDGRLIHVGPVDESLTDDLLSTCFSTRMARMTTPDGRVLAYPSAA